MKTTQKGSAAVVFVIVILVLLIAGAVFAYQSVAHDDITPAVDTNSQQASVPAVIENNEAESVDDISADIEASLTTDDQDIEALNSEFKQ